MTQDEEVQPGGTQPDVVSTRAACPLAAADLTLHLGMMLELFRRRRAMSREQLALALDLAPAEIADYEAGLVRIPPVRLLEIATLLRVPLSSFFQTLGEEARSAGAQAASP